MTTFLSQSCCRGRSPKSFRNILLYDRPRLVSRMATNRTVARFLVAPNGYGKSSLAALYAKVMFQNQDVMWLDASSPCFLRDLDKGTLGEDAMRIAEGLTLVVIDDLPPLSQPRASELSRMIDVLLLEGIEVVVTCSPGSDYYARFQVDRICLSSGDLMMDDDDLSPEATRTDAWLIDWSTHEGACDTKSLRRIPLTYWRGPDAVPELVRLMSAEPLPLEMIRLMFSALVLGEGDTSLLGEGHSERDWARIVGVLEKYPYLGIDLREGRFQAIRLPLVHVVSSFRQKIDSVDQASAGLGLDSLVEEVAGKLLLAGGYSRALELVQLMGSHDLRLRWIVEHGLEAVCAFCFKDFEQLCLTVRIPSGRQGLEISLLRAYARAKLGDERGGSQIASKVLLGPDVSLGVLSALVMARFGGSEHRSHARAFLRGLAESDDCPPTVRLARVLVEEDGRLPLEECVEAGTLSPEALAGSLMWAAEFSPAQATAAIIQYAPGLVEGGSRLAQFLLSKAYARVADEGIRLPAEIGALAAQVLAPCEADLARQAREFAELKPSAGKPRARSASVAKVHEKEKDVPLLRIKLIGTMALFIDDRPVKSEYFRRKNVRVLLALLALNEGRELSRDRLSESMWPHAAPERAHRNIYTITSLLRKALSLSDGSCPYFSRINAGFKLNSQHLTSDIAMVRKICDRYQFGPVDPEAWRADLAFIRAECMGEVIPGEYENDLLRFEKERFSMRMADALLSASRRLLEEGESQLSLWFAQSAFERDQGREEVYLTLMRAQIACGQREAALDTYQRNRRVLAEGLGLDPSPEMVALFRSLIEEEDHI